MDIRSLVRASYDPRRFQNAYHREKRALKQNLAEAVAAEGAPYGSLMQAQDPTRYGSAARQRFSNVFAAPENPAPPPRQPTGLARPGIPERSAASPTSYEELAGGTPYSPLRYRLPSPGSLTPSRGTLSGRTYLRRPLGGR